MSWKPEGSSYSPQANELEALMGRMGGGWCTPYLPPSSPCHCHPLLSRGRIERWQRWIRGTERLLRWRMAAKGPEWTKEAEPAQSVGGSFRMEALQTKTFRPAPTNHQGQQQANWRDVADWHRSYRYKSMSRGSHSNLIWHARLNETLSTLQIVIALLPLLVSSLRHFSHMSSQYGSGTSHQFIKAVLVTYILSNHALKMQTR